jgi:hypothetical protein
MRLTAALVPMEDELTWKLVPSGEPTAGNLSL